MPGADKISKSTKPRPRPLPKSSRFEPETPPRSYAEVAASPSPEQMSVRQRDYAHRSRQISGSPASVIELSDSQEESTPQAPRTTKPSFARVPTSVKMTTRSLNGIVKKRVMEDAAVFSDIEAVSPVSPAKKKKTDRSKQVQEPRPPCRVANVSSPSCRTNTHARQRRTRDISPIASDFRSSDETPPPSIHPHHQKRRLSSDLGNESPTKRSHYDQEDDSAKKPGRHDVDSNDPSGLLPAHTVRSVSRSTPDPLSQLEFEAWRIREEEYYAQLRASKQRPGSGSNVHCSSFELMSRERSAPPMAWSESPPRFPSMTKGKSRAAEPADAWGNDIGAEDQELKRATTMFPLPPDDKGSGSTNATIPPIKFNSFEIALAKKMASDASAKVKSAEAPPTNLDSITTAPSSTSTQNTPVKERPALLAPLKDDLVKPVLDGEPPQDISAESKPLPNSSDKELVLDDINGHRVSALPKTCEVTSIDCQDILLKDDYADLPNLRAGTFRSWNGVPGDGFVLFSGWASQLPTLDVNVAFAPVRFVRHGQFVNLSRVSPLVLHTMNTSHDNTKCMLRADQQMAICLSAILVVECHLLAATDRGLRNKFIKGKLHDQEMQRLVGATCMVFGHGPVLQAQIERDSMIFSTLGNYHSADSMGVQFVILVKDYEET